MRGELLDIDGTCGGYNLQWAWSSGAVAGKNAAKEEKKLIRISQLKLPITHTKAQLEKRLQNIKKSRKQFYLRDKKAISGLQTQK